MTIRANRRYYHEEPCPPPPLHDACAGCDLYRPEGREGFTRCMKPKDAPSCIAALRPDNTWIVYKRGRG